MEKDSITEVGIDEKGRLYIMPLKLKFPFIYREAMEIHWDDSANYLYAPPPLRSQLATPSWWFFQIISAAKEQSCELQLEPNTKWNNVPPDIKKEIVSMWNNHRTGE